jgi:phosphoglycolate phosphatase
MPPRAANILFDLDGTLTDSRPGIIGSIQHALRSLGVQSPPAPELLWCVGPPLREIFGRLLPDPESRDIERAVVAYVERYRAVGLRENRLYEGIPDMLSALGVKSRLVLVTAKHQDSAERILELFELRPHFSGVFGSEPSGFLADKRDLIRHTMETLGLDSSETVIVGDRIHDIEGGRHNGIVTVGATWGYGTSGELADAHHLCHSPQEVAALLSQI